MDVRRTVVVGGGAAVASGLAIACLLVVSNAVALTDVAGAPISERPVLLPSTTPSHTDPVFTPSPSTTTRPDGTTKTVPAPKPRDVGGSGDRSSSGTAPRPGKTTPPIAAQPTPSAEAPARDPRTGSQAIAQFEKDGDLDALKKWVADQGWSAAKAKLWLKYAIDRYEQRHGGAELHADLDTELDTELDVDADADIDTDTSSFGTTQTPARAGSASGHNLPRSWAGSKRGQSPGF